MFNFRNQQGITVKELINQKIKNNLYNLTSIFKNKQNQNIPSAFILLKSFDKNNKNFHQNDNPNEKLTNVSSFRAKHMKATDEQILAAVDGEMCAQQAEKLRIIRSHMDSLEMCKVNLESLILTTA